MMTVLRIKVDYNNRTGTYMAVKDYGDDLGYLEEIGEGATPNEAIEDLLPKWHQYTISAYKK